MPVWVGTPTQNPLRKKPLYLPGVQRGMAVLGAPGTGGQGNRKVYYFSISYSSGQAKYVAANINTDPRPALQQRQRLEETARARADRIKQGLEVARQRNTSQQNERVFERVETLLAHVRGGISFPDALRHVNLSPSVLEQLEKLVNLR